MEDLDSVDPAPPRLRPSHLRIQAARVFDWLKRRDLPALVHRQETVRVLRLLKRAGYVSAEIPAMAPGDHGTPVQPPAVVSHLTPAGHAWRATLNGLIGASIGVSGSSLSADAPK